VNNMPGPKPPEVKLTDDERQGLEKLVRRHSTPQQIALRGRIVLAADDGQNSSQIARELGIMVKTVRQWRNRWLLLQPIALDDLSIQERLEDLPRSGAPPRICEEPGESERPISHWTGREIAEEIMKREIVEKISARHARRLLKRCRSQTPSGALLVDSSL
jgi:putative transposase